MNYNGKNSHAIKFNGKMCEVNQGLIDQSCASDPSELELKSIVNHLRLTLETELQFRQSIT